MDKEAKSTAGWDGVVDKSRRYITGDTAVELRDWIFHRKWGSGGLPLPWRNFRKKKDANGGA